MRWLRIALAASSLAAALPALGLSCPPRFYDEAEARTMFGPAKVVFVGTLLRTLKEKRFENWHSSDIGVFTIEQAFKGAPDRPQRVRINADTAPGLRYLVYAIEEKGELRADAACWPRAIPSPRNAGQIAYLETLPAPGSGGEVFLGGQGLLRKPLDGPVPDFALDFAGTGANFRLVTDKDGKARASGVPAGVYRIATAPPSGYRFDCNYGKSCDGLRVHDRGLDEFVVILLPLAVLKVEVRDAHGNLADLRAEFNLYDPCNGRLIGPFSNYWSYSLINARPFAAVERIVPGEYVLGLVLTTPRLDGNVHKVARQAVVFEHGAPNALAASHITVKPGDNVATFTLPPALKPVRTQLEFVDGGPDFRPGISLIVAGTKPYTEEAGYYFWKPSEHPDVSAFWSIPGQTWKIGGLFGSDAIEGGTYGKITVAPVRDGTIRLKVIKAF
jgi:hypothetical protein